MAKRNFTCWAEAESEPVDIKPDSEHVVYDYDASEAAHVYAGRYFDACAGDAGDMFVILVLDQEKDTRTTFDVKVEAEPVFYATERRASDQQEPA